MTQHNCNTLTLRPFNLQQALAGKPVVTRNGHHVIGCRLITEAAQSEQRLVGVINGCIERFREHTGKYYNSDAQSQNDLFMLSVKQTMWFGRRIEYSGGDKYQTTMLYPTRERALHVCKDSTSEWEVLSVEVEV